MMPSQKVDKRKQAWTPERRLQHSAAMKRAWARKRGGIWGAIKRFFMGA